MNIRDKELIVVYLKVKCPKCRKIWGIRLGREDDFSSILERQTICEFCANRIGEYENEYNRTTK